jgi:hypothetical protein
VEGIAWRGRGTLPVEVRVGKRAANETDRGGVLEKLAAMAKRLPDVEEGVACAGTVVESRTMKVKGKAFLFLRAGQAMVKLDGSLPEAEKAAKKSPGCIFPGSGGWTKILFKDGPPEMPLMERWIRESYGLVAGPKAAPKRPVARKSVSVNVRTKRK